MLRLHHTHKTLKRYYALRTQRLAARHVPFDCTEYNLIDCFRSGLDTHQIAYAFKVPEHVIYNALAKARA